MQHFISGDIIAWDTETTGTNPWKGDCPFALSFCNLNGQIKYFEFDVDPFTRQVKLGKAERHSLEEIRALLEDPKVWKIGHNIKFDVRMMERNFGIRMKGGFYDTMILAHNCNTLEPSLGLKQLCAKYTDIGRDDQQDLKKAVQGCRREAKKLGWNIAFDITEQFDGSIKQRSNAFADYWLPKALWKQGQLPERYAGAENLCERYARLDAERTMLLYLLLSDIVKEYGVEYARDLEHDLWHVIYAMETRGVCTDVEAIQRMKAENIAEINRLTPILEKAAWPGFRPRNEGDCRRLFYDVLKLPVTKYTKGGKGGKNPKPAVDKFVIIEHIDKPVIRDLAIWKSNCTCFTSFFSKYERLSIPDEYGGEFALHCDYRQIGGDQAGNRAGVATARVSSSNPNMQNVMTPENTMAAHPIPVRPAFIPRPGYVWLCTDYEGMEMRVFAALSQEPFMMKAIREGRSIHTEMTNRIWGGRGNHWAIVRAIRALSLDGTGIGQDKTWHIVETIWKKWGLNPQNVLSLTPRRREEFATEWMEANDWDIVRAEASIKRNNSKTFIKSLSFLKIYGGGPKKARILLHCTVPEAKEVLDNYDRLFPDVARYFNQIMDLGRRQGYITSAWGRRLAIDPFFAYRACNYMVQGSSADCMKRAMVRIHQWLVGLGIDAHVLMTIHDEIVIELRRDLLTKPFIRKVSALMCDTEGHLPIDMAVEPKVVTENWSIKRKIKL